MKSVHVRIFFCSVFSCIQTEYGHLCKSSYSVRIQENTGKKKNPYLDTFHRVYFTAHVSGAVHAQYHLTYFLREKMLQLIPKRQII